MVHCIVHCMVHCMVHCVYMPQHATLRQAASLKYENAPGAYAKHQTYALQEICGRWMGFAAVVSHFPVFPLLPNLGQGLLDFGHILVWQTGCPAQKKIALSLQSLKHPRLLNMGECAANQAYHKMGTHAASFIHHVCLQARQQFNASLYNKA